MACDAAAAQGFVGRPADAEAARIAARAHAVRTIRPGEMVTQDYRADRLTLTLDAAGRIVSARCG